MLPFDPALARMPQAGLGGGALAAGRRGHGRARRIRTGAALDDGGRREAAEIEGERWRRYRIEREALAPLWRRERGKEGETRGWRGGDRG